MPVPVGHQYVFFGKMSVQVPAHFLNVLFVFVVVVIELCVCFIFFEYESLIRYMIWKYRLSFCRILLNFVGGFLCCAKSL